MRVTFQIQDFWEEFVMHSLLILNISEIGRRERERQRQRQRDRETETETETERDRE